MLYVLFWSGLRASELCGLTTAENVYKHWGMLDLKGFDRMIAIIDYNRYCVLKKPVKSGVPEVMF